MRAHRKASARDTPIRIDERREMRLAAARSLVGMRDLRETMLGDHIPFADPSWDIILDLYVAAIEGKQRAVSDVCIVARVPTTTALRWIDHLVGLSLLERMHDPEDRRRRFVSLSSAQLSAMDAFFDALAASTSAGVARSKRCSS